MLNFPNSPTVGQRYSFGVKTWEWNGIAWDLASISDAQVAAAELAAVSAANSFDMFDDRFLGAKAFDPIVDNDGDTLTEGALYWNSTAKGFLVYNGTAWQAVAPTGNLQKITYVGGVDYTAGVTTTLTLPGDPLVQANVNIVFDGAWQQQTEFTLAGTTITFDVAIPVGVAQVEISYTAPLQIGAPSAGTVSRDKLAADLELKLLEIPSADDFIASGSTAVAAAVSVQAALVAGNLKFVSGRTYDLASLEISVPSNRRIVIENGAVVNCTNVRWTSYNENNVEWHIDGRINALSMAIVAAKTGWPNIAAGTGIGDERGFIEFGGSSLLSASVSGFKVHGHGKVVGPWSGTPNFIDGVNQVNRKGIASWNCSDVLVEGLEVIGFDGEAIYWFGNTDDCIDIRFDNNHVHDTRFNALNFNTTGAWKGLSMTGNRALNAYTGIEASAGNIVGNYVRGTTNYGIWEGLGGGHGPMHIKGNTVEMCDGESFVCTYSAGGIYDFLVQGNIAIASGSNSFVLNNINCFNMSGNISRGHARLAAGFAFKTTTTCSQGLVGGNDCIDAGGLSLGAYSIEGADVQMMPNYTTTVTGVTSQYIGNDARFFGGKNALATTYGSRENQLGIHSSSFVAGAGGEFAFRNGSAGATTYASIAGRGNAFDGSGSTGGIAIATKKATTGGALTATAQFDSAGNTVLTGGFGCNGAAAQTPAVSGGTLAGVIAALVANGILSS